MSDTTSVRGLSPCLRLVSALCVETSEEWMTNRRFLDMDALTEMLEVERKEGVKLTAVS